MANIIKGIATDMFDMMNDKNAIDNLCWCPYWVLRTLTTNSGINLHLVATPTKFREEDSGRLYFGVYYYWEIDGGDNFTDADWCYTDDDKESSLLTALQEIFAETPSEELIKNFDKEEKRESVRARVRIFLDKIYHDACTLAEGFGDKICDEITDTLIVNNHENFTGTDISRKLVEETMFRCYQAKMQ